MVTHGYPDTGVFTKEEFQAVLETTRRYGRMSAHRIGEESRWEPAWLKAIHRQPLEMTAENTWPGPMTRLEHEKDWTPEG